MQEIGDDVAALSDKMNKRRWPGVALLGFGGVVGSVLSAAATIASGGTALVVGLGVGAGAIELGAAGYQALDLLKEPRFDARAPLAYAALAGRL